MTIVASSERARFSICARWWSSASASNRTRLRTSQSFVVSSIASSTLSSLSRNSLVEW
jgi:hypothetical protein